MRAGSSVGRRWLLIAGIAAVIGQFWGLYSPGDATPQIVLPAGADKVVHALLFGIPVALLLVAGVRRRLVLPLAFAQVVVSEIVQAVWIPGRAGDVWDAVADVIGIGLGVAAAAVGPRMLRPHGDAASPSARVVDQSSSRF